MPNLETILRSIDELSVEEKLIVRNVLDGALSSGAALGTGKKRSELIGLFADDAAALDRIMHAVYQSRELPLRVE